jgi:hypothetical protein
MTAVASNLFYLLRLVIFLIRGLLFAVYCVLEVMSKPAARRLIFPASAAAASYVCRLPLDAAIQTYVRWTWTGGGCPSR